MYLVLFLLALGSQCFAASSHVYDKVFSQWAKGRYESAIFLSKKHGKRLLADTIRSDALLNSGHDKFYCAYALEFLKKRPDWPAKERLLQKADSLMPNWSDSEVLAWCNVYSPRAPWAHKRYAIAMAKKHGLSAKVIPLIQRGWILGNFTCNQERDYLRKYGQHIKYADYKSRAANLLMRGDKVGAQRQVEHLSVPDKELVLASIEMLNKGASYKKSFAKFCKLKRLTHEMAYLFIQSFTASENIPKKDLELIVGALGFLGPERTHLDKWAAARAKLARELLACKSYRSAYKVASGTCGEGTAYRSQFLSGWIALTFLKDSKAALGHFLKMKPHCTSVRTIAKNYYWLARALFSLKRAEEGRSYMAKAASYCNSFYGQVAMEELKRGQFPSFKHSLPSAEAPAGRMEELETISLLNTYGKEELAAMLCRRLFPKLSKPQVVYALGYLKREGLMLNSVRWNSKLGALAATRGVIDLSCLLPVLQMDQSLDLEAPLLHAVVKAESCFNPKACSGSGALGLMQLRAPTAIETAEKYQIRLNSREDISDPQINLQLGNLYMTELLAKYSGSYILALAAYNAGSSRVATWIARYGKPHSCSLHSALNWIESIPFLETREYVQAILSDRNLYEVVLNRHRRLGMRQVLCGPGHLRSVPSNTAFKDRATNKAAPI